MLFHSHQFCVRRICREKLGAAIPAYDSGRQLLHRLGFLLDEEQYIVTLRSDFAPRESSVCSLLSVDVPRALRSVLSVWRRQFERACRERELQREQEPPTERILSGFQRALLRAFVRSLFRGR